MKWLASLPKIEPRGKDISDKLKLEIADKKQFRRLVCIKFSLLALAILTSVIAVVQMLLGVFHPQAYSNYGITIGIFTIVLAKALPYALFPYNKDSKYPCTVFYAFGVAQLIMVGMVILLLNRLDSFWRAAPFMGDNKGQVFASGLFRLNYIIQCTLIVSLNERINLPTRNDYIFKKNSLEIQKCTPQSLIPFLILTLGFLIYIINVVFLLNRKL